MKNSFTALLTGLLVFLIILSDINAQSFYTGKVGTTLSIYGRVRIFSDSLVTRQIDRSSLLVATAPSAVFDYKKDAEVIDTSKTIVNPLHSDFEVYGSIDNSYNDPAFPPNVLCKINLYGWNNIGGIVAKFTIINREAELVNAIAGMEIIPQPDNSYGLETIEYISSAKVVSIYRAPSSKITGYKILSAEMTTVNTIDWYAEYSDVDDSLYNWMTTGTLQSIFEAGGDGPVTFISQNSLPINAGDSTVFYVGISVGSNQSEMLANMNDIVTKYNILTDVKESLPLVISEFKLDQNYPNPFNPNTTIQFTLPKSDYVSLKIYDILGNKVADLVNQNLPEGNHEVNFNAANLSSGTYLYRLSAGGYSVTKKMTLIK